MELSKKLAPEWVKVEHAGEVLEFLCAPLTSRDLLNVYALAEGGRAGDAAWESVIASVRDWRGFTRDGEPARFSRGALEAALGGADMAGVLGSLSAQVMARSQLTETERKN
jgi:hypothetical protein